MILSPLILDLRDLGIGDSGSVRAEGLHASTIYNSLFAEMYPKKYAYDGPINPLLVEMGLIYETMLEEGLKRRLAASGGGQEGRIVRPGELSYVGEFEGVGFTVYYNPDLLIFNHITRIGEIKSRWASSHLTHDTIAKAQAGDEEALASVEAVALEPGFEKYHTQTMLYAKFLGTRFGRLFVWFVNANYKPPFPSQFVIWDVEYTEDEIHQNYHMCMSHALSQGMIG